MVSTVKPIRAGAAAGIRLELRQHPSRPKLRLYHITFLRYRPCRLRRRTSLDSVYSGGGALYEVARRARGPRLSRIVCTSSLVVPAHAGRWRARRYAFGGLGWPRCGSAVDVTGRARVFSGLRSSLRVWRPTAAKAARDRAPQGESLAEQSCPGATVRDRAVSQDPSANFRSSGWRETVALQRSVHLICLCDLYPLRR